MEIGTIRKAESFEVAVGDVKLRFMPVTQKDQVYASILISYPFPEIAKESAISKDAAVSYMLTRLESYEGSITSNGKPLSVDELRAAGPNLPASFVGKVAYRWAKYVYVFHGYIKEEGAEEKKDEAPGEPDSSQAESTSQS